jgi:hypothetical protein
MITAAFLILHSLQDPLFCYDTRGGHLSWPDKVFSEVREKWLSLGVFEEYETSRGIKNES